MFVLNVCLYWLSENIFFKDRCSKTGFKKHFLWKAVFFSFTFCSLRNILVFKNKNVFSNTTTKKKNSFAKNCLSKELRLRRKKKRFSIKKCFNMSPYVSFESTVLKKRWFVCHVFVYVFLSFCFSFFMYVCIHLCICRIAAPIVFSCASRSVPRAVSRADNVICVVCSFCFLPFDIVSFFVSSVLCCAVLACLRINEKTNKKFVE